MLKCDLAYVFSCKIPAFFQTTFSYEYLWTDVSKSYFENCDKKL